MRSRRITRYYCDFCKKAGMNMGVIRRHENMCFKNPARVCGLCEEADIGPQVSIADLMACLSFDADNYGMKELREMARECPACIMAAIMQRKLQSPEDFREEGPLNYDFEYKAEMDKWYARQHEGSIRF